jgi:hypothetical protein
MKIKIIRAEGPTGTTGWSYACGTFQEMDTILISWGRSAPERGGGYDKCDCVVEFNDEDSYAFRYDLTRGSGEGYDRADFRKNLLTRMKFAAGRYCPGHYTQEQYDGFIASIPTLVAEAAELLDRVQLIIEESL